MDESKPLRVLIVDDDPGARDAAARAVRAIGYECETAVDGVDAIAVHHVRPADIVLSDWAMPRMARKVTLESSIERSPIDADPDLLRRLLANLLDNAVRHTLAQTTVRLTIAAVPGATEIKVADRGAGIPREMRERVFDPFVQLERERGALRSSRGLGLTFCKLAAEAHGGTITVTDGEPGAVFCVRLPDAG